MKLSHRWDGSEAAPALVLPCSLGTTRELWEPQLSGLTRSFRVLRYEHRGHGRTPASPGGYTMEELARDTLELLDDLGLERVSFCGLSLGGMVGMWVGGNAPERLTSLVLACTSAHVASPDVYAERASLVREHGIEPVADAVVSRWFTPAAPPELRARFREILVSTSRDGYAGCCEAVAGWDFRQELPRVTVPTLVVAASRDEATPKPDTDLLAERIPGARRLELDGAAHLANLEQPRAFTDAVLAHALEPA